MEIPGWAFNALHTYLFLPMTSTSTNMQILQLHTLYRLQNSEVLGAKFGLVYILCIPQIIEENHSCAIQSVPVLTREVKADK